MSSLTITLIQTNLLWEDKKANLEMLSGKIESIKEKTEVIILPEMFSTGFSMKPNARRKYEWRDNAMDEKNCFGKKNNSYRKYYH